MKQLIPINNCYFSIRLYLDHILRYESKISLHFDHAKKGVIWIPGSNQLYYSRNILVYPMPKFTNQHMTATLYDEKSQKEYPIHIQYVESQYIEAMAQLNYSLAYHYPTLDKPILYLPLPNTDDKQTYVLKGFLLPTEGQILEQDTNLNNILLTATAITQREQENVTLYGKENTPYSYFWIQDTSGDYTPIIFS